MNDWAPSPPPGQASGTPAGQPDAAEAGPGPGSAMTTPSAPMDVMPFDARRLAQAREQWGEGNWPGLAQVDAEQLAGHPDGGALALIGAAAALQIGDRITARERAWQARAWATDRRQMARVLLASARQSLGRASLAARRPERASEHFQRSLFDPGLVSEARRHARARVDQFEAELAARRQLAANQRKAGVKPNDKPQQAWIGDLVARCVAAADLHEAVDTVLDQVLASAEHRALFLMRLSEHFLVQRDKMMATHCLNLAKDQSAELPHELRLALARQLVLVGQPIVAVDLLVDDALNGTDAGPAEAGFTQTVQQAYRGLRETEQSRHEHGHELLLAYLKLQIPRLLAQAGGRRMKMVEIGTTREQVPGQGSTRKLGEFCTTHGIDFVTVDMDPHNSRSAERLFESLSMPYRAITMKGEDYLRQLTEPVDFVFLDAYDFDHGGHSELRQSRYVKFLGSRIDEAACHQMHLDCAESLLRWLTPHGIICVDDTWTEDGVWTAKGKLAMPFLLENGFELIDARNRAALLKRVQAGQ